MMYSEIITSMDVKVIASVIGVFGLLVAALLSSAGYLYRSRLEGKKSARKVLYLLLEIRYAVKASLFDVNEMSAKYIAHYVSRMQAKGMPIKKEEMEAMMLDTIKSHFENVISALKTDVENRLLPPFEEALMELATVAPVLAYRLRGKEKVEALVDLTKSYIADVDSQIISKIDDDFLKNILVKVSKSQQSNALNEVSANLDDDVLLLAKHCGRSDFSQCKKALNSGITSGVDFSTLDGLIDTMLESINAAIKVRDQTTAT
ncbi:MAG: nucleoside diphosphate kinase [Cocleimonas sp.]|jgi:nucleoside diphosphate kinase